MGGEELNVSDYIVIQNEKPSSFGATLASIGDANADGYDDIIIGAPSYGLYNVFPHGKIYVYLGGKEIDTTADFTLMGKYIHDTMGSCVNGIGDINNDGYDDFAATAPYNWVNGIGRARIFLGGEKIDSSNSIIINSDLFSAQFGYSISSIGDINKDGYDDFAIGATEEGDKESNGKVFIFYGESEIDSDYNEVISTSAIGDYGFGLKIISLKNIFSLADNMYGVLSGKYFHIFNKQTEITTIDITRLGGTGLIDVCGGQDINRDGYNDFIIGNTNLIKDDKMIGGVWGYWGGETSDTLYDFHFYGENHWGNFGRSVAMIGDINNDGYVELAVTATGWPHYDKDIGKVYIYSCKNITSVKENKSSSPVNYKLNQNYPNPFNPSTTIQFSIPVSEKVKLDIFNVLGQKVATLVNGNLEAGTHKVQFNASNLSSGIYFYRVHSENFNSVKKMTLIK